MSEKGPSDDPIIAEVGTGPYIDPIEEKKLLRRIDVFTISIMGLLYLMCFLDRGNMCVLWTSDQARAYP